MKKRAVFGGPGGLASEFFSKNNKMVKSVSSPNLSEDIMRRESLYHDKNATLFGEEKQKNVNNPDVFFKFEGNCIEPRLPDVDVDSLQGFKRRACGLTRRNVSSNNLSSMPSPQSTEPFRSPVTNQIQPMMSCSSCPDLQDAEKKQLRLERNRNAARLRRHKRRLVVETLEKEKAGINASLELISKLRQNETGEISNLPFDLSLSLLRGITAPDKFYVYPEDNNEKYQLLSRVLGRKEECKSWCPKLKQKGVELFLFCQHELSISLQKSGRINILISILAQKDDNASIKLTDDQKRKLKSLLKGLIFAQVRLRVLCKICRCLMDRVSSGEMTVPMPLIESGLNAFRSVLTEEQIDRFYLLAENGYYHC